ncbi:PLP-dependent aminotransferase family protein [Bosea sp. (in: a-proteobacteria)]|uniref:aminotransferase-like domain-containing protein n=1 Tax=Bosea sp. (in: a-proteobacteria) TaxID=1871050 RepID=UPI0025C18EF8|nr:PLP-dependent aminotransferase family protein [Bosea sp. (in: a-proteobacteria)]MBR3192814.1 PLP-dependent aminotransferase family protein [Bosea sp. (in: a-proteobacteria)]
MTIYVPTLSDSAASKADRIATAIEADIKLGRLQPGAQLPTHRALALALKVTPGTVSRAYALLEQQGLLRGEVGRGTFVADPKLRSPDVVVSASLAAASTIDLAVNRNASKWVEAAVAEALLSLDRDAMLGTLMTYQPDSGMVRHRVAWTQFLKGLGVEAHPDRLILTAGAQHATFLILSVLASPGDVILAEDFTYAGFKALADELRMRPEPVRMDGEGILPDDLERVARATGAKWLYLMPQVQNPTMARMPPHRRQALLAVARALDLRIIEDGVYDPLRPSAVASLVTLDPERVFYVTSLSKCLAPGLRIGCIVAPESWSNRLARAIRRSMWMIPVLGAELSTRWIETQEMPSLLRKQRRELEQRSACLRSILPDLTKDATLDCGFAWLKLPDEVRSESVVAAAQELGVMIAPTEAFTLRKGAGSGFIRLNLSASGSLGELQLALQKIQPLLRGASLNDRGYY